MFSVVDGRGAMRFTSCSTGLCDSFVSYLNRRHSKVTHSIAFVTIENGEGKTGYKCGLIREGVSRVMSKFRALDCDH